MRTRIAIAGAWILGTAVTSGLAWGAVRNVESGITTRGEMVVSPRDVDRALAPLAVSSTTELPVSTPSAPVTTPSTTVSAPGAPQTTADGVVPSAPPTTLPPPQQTTVVPPPVVTVTTTAPQPTSTTSGPQSTVIPTIGGTIGVTCPTPSTIRLVYATPSAGYTYSPGEITPTHIHVKFTKGSQSVKVEVECSGGRVDTSFEEDD